MKRYVIVKEYSKGSAYHSAYKYNIFFRIFGNNFIGFITDTYTYKGADECERLLRQYLNQKKPEIVRILDI